MVSSGENVEEIGWDFIRDGSDDQNVQASCTENINTEMANGDDDDCKTDENNNNVTEDIIVISDDETNEETALEAVGSRITTQTVILTFRRTVTRENGQTFYSNYEYEQDFYEH